MAVVTTPPSLKALREAFLADEGLNPIRSVSNLPLCQHDEGLGLIGVSVLPLRFHWAANSLSIPFSFSDGVAIRRDPLQHETVLNEYFTGGESAYDTTPYYVYFHQALAQLSERLLGQTNVRVNLFTPFETLGSEQEGRLDNLSNFLTWRVETLGSDDVPSRVQISALLWNYGTSAIGATPISVPVHIIHPFETLGSEQDGGLEILTIGSTWRVETLGSDDVPSAFQVAAFYGTCAISVTGARTAVSRPVRVASVNGYSATPEGDQTPTLKGKPRAAVFQSGYGHASEVSSLMAAAPLYPSEGSLDLRWRGRFIAKFAIFRGEALLKSEPFVLITLDDATRRVRGDVAPSATYGQRAGTSPHHVGVHTAVRFIANFPIIRGEALLKSEPFALMALNGATRSVMGDVAPSVAYDQRADTSPHHVGVRTTARSIANFPIIRGEALLKSEPFTPIPLEGTTHRVMSGINLIKSYDQRADTSPYHVGVQATGRFIANLPITRDEALLKSEPFTLISMEGATRRVSGDVTQAAWDDQCTDTSPHHVGVQLIRYTTAESSRLRNEILFRLEPPVSLYFENSMYRAVVLLEVMTPSSMTFLKTSLHLVGGGDANIEDGSAHYPQLGSASSEKAIAGQVQLLLHVHGGVVHSSITVADTGIWAPEALLPTSITPITSGSRIPLVASKCLVESFGAVNHPSSFNRFVMIGRVGEAMNTHQVTLLVPPSLAGVLDGKNLLLSDVLRSTNPSYRRADANEHSGMTILEPPSTIDTPLFVNMRIAKMAILTTIVPAPDDKTPVNYQATPRSSPDTNGGFAAGFNRDLISRVDQCDETTLRHAARQFGDLDRVGQQAQFSVMINRAVHCLTDELINLMGRDGSTLGEYFQWSNASWRNAKDEDTLRRTLVKVANKWREVKRRTTKLPLSLTSELNDIARGRRNKGEYVEPHLDLLRASIGPFLTRIGDGQIPDNSTSSTPPHMLLAWECTVLAFNAIQVGPICSSGCTLQPQLVQRMFGNAIDQSYTAYCMPDITTGPPLSWRYALAMLRDDQYEQYEHSLKHMLSLCNQAIDVRHYCNHLHDQATPLAPGLAGIAVTDTTMNKFTNPFRLRELLRQGKPWSESVFESQCILDTIADQRILDALMYAVGVAIDQRVFRYLANDSTSAVMVKDMITRANSYSLRKLVTPTVCTTLLDEQRLAREARSVARIDYDQEVCIRRIGYTCRCQDLRSILILGRLGGYGNWRQSESTVMLDFKQVVRMFWLRGRVFDDGTHDWTVSMIMSPQSACTWPVGYPFRGTIARGEADTDFTLVIHSPGTTGNRVARTLTTANDTDADHSGPWAVFSNEMLRALQGDDTISIAYLPSEHSWSSRLDNLYGDDVATGDTTSALVYWLLGSIYAPKTTEVGFGEWMHSAVGELISSLRFFPEVWGVLSAQSCTGAEDPRRLIAHDPAPAAPLRHISRGLTSEAKQSIALWDALWRCLHIPCIGTPPGDWANGMAQTSSRPAKELGVHYIELPGFLCDSQATSEMDEDRVTQAKARLLYLCSLQDYQKDNVGLAPITGCWFNYDINHLQYGFMSVVVTCEFEKRYTTDLQSTSALLQAGPLSPGNMLTIASKALDRSNLYLSRRRPSDLHQAAHMPMASDAYLIEGSFTYMILAAMNVYRKLADSGFFMPIFRTNHTASHRSMLRQWQDLFHYELPEYQQGHLSPRLYDISQQATYDCAGEVRPLGVVIHLKWWLIFDSHVLAASLTDDDAARIIQRNFSSFAMGASLVWSQYDKRARQTGQHLMKKIPVVTDHEESGGKGGSDGGIRAGYNGGKGKGKAVFPTRKFTGGRVITHTSGTHHQWLHLDADARHARVLAGDALALLWAVEGGTFREMRGRLTYSLMIQSFLLTGSRPVVLLLPNFGWNGANRDGFHFGDLHQTYEQSPTMATATNVFFAHYFDQYVREWLTRYTTESKVTDRAATDHALHCITVAACVPAWLQPTSSALRNLLRLVMVTYGSGTQEYWAAAALLILAINAESGDPFYSMSACTSYLGQPIPYENRSDHAHVGGPLSLYALDAAGGIPAFDAAGVFVPVLSDKATVEYQLGCSNGYPVRLALLIPGLGLRVTRAQNCTRVEEMIVLTRRSQEIRNYTTALRVDEGRVIFGCDNAVFEPYLEATARTPTLRSRFNPQSSVPPMDCPYDIVVEVPPVFPVYQRDSASSEAATPPFELHARDTFTNITERPLHSWFTLSTLEFVGNFQQWFNPGVKDEAIPASCQDYVLQAASYDKFIPLTDQCVRPPPPPTGDRRIVPYDGRSASRRDTDHGRDGSSSFSPPYHRSPVGNSSSGDRGTYSFSQSYDQRAMAPPQGSAHNGKRPVPHDEWSTGARSKPHPLCCYARPFACSTSRISLLAAPYRRLAGYALWQIPSAAGRDDALEYPRSTSSLIVANHKVIAIPESFSRPVFALPGSAEWGGEESEINAMANTVAIESAIHRYAIPTHPIFLMHAIYARGGGPSMAHSTATGPVLRALAHFIYPIAPGSEDQKNCVSVHYEDKAFRPGIIMNDQLEITPFEARPETLRSTEKHRTDPRGFWLSCGVKPVVRGLFQTEISRSGGTQNSVIIQTLWILRTPKPCPPKHTLISKGRAGKQPITRMALRGGGPGTLFSKASARAAAARSPALTQATSLVVEATDKTLPIVELPISDRYLLMECAQYNMVGSEQGSLVDLFRTVEVVDVEILTLAVIPAGIPVQPSYIEMIGQIEDGLTTPLYIQLLEDYITEEELASQIRSSLGKFADQVLSQHSADEIAQRVLHVRGSANRARGELGLPRYGSILVILETQPEIFSGMDENYILTPGFASPRGEESQMVARARKCIPSMSNTATLWHNLMCHLHFFRHANTSGRPQAEFGSSISVLQDTLPDNRFSPFWLPKIADTDQEFSLIRAFLRMTTESFSATAGKRPNDAVLVEGLNRWVDSLNGGFTFRRETQELPTFGAVAEVARLHIQPDSEVHCKRFTDLLALINLVARLPGPYGFLLKVLASVVSPITSLHYTTGSDRFIDHESQTAGFVKFCMDQLELHVAVHVRMDALDSPLGYWPTTGLGFNSPGTQSPGLLQLIDGKPTLVAGNRTEKGVRTVYSLPESTEDDETTPSILTPLALLIESIRHHSFLSVDLKVNLDLVSSLCKVPNGERTSLRNRHDVSPLDARRDIMLQVLHDVVAAAYMPDGEPNCLYERAMEFTRRTARTVPSLAGIHPVHTPSFARFPAMDSVLGLDSERGCASRPLPLYAPDAAGTSRAMSHLGYTSHLRTPMPTQQQIVGAYHTETSPSAAEPPKLEESKAKAVHEDTKSLHDAPTVPSSAYALPDRVPIPAHASLDKGRGQAGRPTSMRGRSGGIRYTPREEDALDDKAALSQYPSLAALSQILPARFQDADRGPPQQPYGKMVGKPATMANLSEGIKPTLREDSKPWDEAVMHHSTRTSDVPDQVIRVPPQQTSERYKSVGSDRDGAHLQTGADVSGRFRRPDVPDQVMQRPPQQTSKRHKSVGSDHDGAYLQAGADVSDRLRRPPATHTEPSPPTRSQDLDAAFAEARETEMGPDDERATDIIFLLFSREFPSNTRDHPTHSYAYAYATQQNFLVQNGFIRAGPSLLPLVNLGSAFLNSSQAYEFVINHFKAEMPHQFDEGMFRTHVHYPMNTQPEGLTSVQTFHITLEPLGPHNVRDSATKFFHLLDSVPAIPDTTSLQLGTIDTVENQLMGDDSRVLKQHQLSVLRRVKALLGSRLPAVPKELSPATQILQQRNTAPLSDIHKTKDRCCAALNVRLLQGSTKELVPFWQSRVAILQAMDPLSADLHLCEDSLIEHVGHNSTSILGHDEVKKPPLSGQDAVLRAYSEHTRKDSPVGWILTEVVTGRGRDLEAMALMRADNRRTKMIQFFAFTYDTLYVLMTEEAGGNRPAGPRVIMAAAQAFLYRWSNELLIRNDPGSHDIGFIDTQPLQNPLSTPSQNLVQFLVHIEQSFTTVRTLYNGNLWDVVCNFIYPRTMLKNVLTEVRRAYPFARALLASCLHGLVLMANQADPSAANRETPIRRARDSLPVDGYRSVAEARSMDCDQTITPVYDILRFPFHSGLQGQPQDVMPVALNSITSASDAAELITKLIGEVKHFPPGCLVRDVSDMAPIQMMTGGSSPPATQTEADATQPPSAGMNLASDATSSALAAIAKRLENIEVDSRETRAQQTTLSQTLALDSKGIHDRAERAGGHTQVYYMPPPHPQGMPFHPANPYHAQYAMHAYNFEPPEGGVYAMTRSGAAAVAGGGTQRLTLSVPRPPPPDGRTPSAGQRNLRAPLEARFPKTLIKSLDATCAKILRSHGITDDDDERYTKVGPQGCLFCKNRHPPAWCPAAWVLSSQCPADKYSQAQRDVRIMNITKAQTQQQLMLSDVVILRDQVADDDYDRIIMGLVTVENGCSECDMRSDGALYIVHDDVPFGDIPDPASFAMTLTPPVMEASEAHHE